MYQELLKKTLSKTSTKVILGDVQCEDHNADRNHLQKSVKKNHRPAIAKDTHRCVVHVVSGNGHDRWQRENDTNEEGPADTSYIACQTQPTIAHVERAGFKHDLGMAVEHSSAKDGDNITQIQCHSGEGENGVGSDGAGEVEKTRKDTDEGGKPNGTQRCECFFRVLAKEATVRKT